MLSGEGDEKSEKIRIGLISKRATLHVQHTFFEHFFAVVLHKYNVKLSEILCWYLIIVIIIHTYIHTQKDKFSTCF